MKLYELTNICNYRVLAAAAACAFAMVCAEPAFSLPASHYASSSALASGNWHKVRINATGMQFVSNQQLAQWGFSDPAKVNVYGFGGRVISELLNDAQPDDLPLLPCVRTSEGIVFFGVDHTLWAPSSSSRSVWTHTIHPYSENSYYFLSDAPATGSSIPVIDLASESVGEITEYTARISHELDQFAPSVSGRNLLGEDMRNGATLSLSFSLPGNVDGRASVISCFGSSISGGTSSISFASNGRVSQNSLSLPSRTSSGQFVNFSTASINVENCGSNLRWDMTFRNSGVVSYACLDYVEVEYQRSLSLSDDQLHFYFYNDPGTVALSGVNSQTQLWDVTVAHAPVRVNFRLEGSTAYFSNPSGHREYVAFNPAAVRNAPGYVGAVGNQNLHSLPVPDMLIVSPPEYRQASERLADLHRSSDGMVVHVLDPQAIYNEFSSGTPDVSAFRKILKMWYDRGLESSGASDTKIKYCLMMGRASYDNKLVTNATRQEPYPRLPIWQSPTGYTESTSFSCDDFIGVLEDTRGSVLSLTGAQIDVAVGRFPVRSLQEANTAVNKVINYINKPILGPWRNNIVHVADDQDRGAHLLQTLDSIVGLREKSPGGDRFKAEQLYFDAYERVSAASGYTYPEVRTKLFQGFDNSAFLTYIGHANTVSWSHEGVMNWTDITNFDNTRTPILFAATCEFARWDADEICGAEVMWAYPQAGVIACIVPSRSVYIATNGRMAAGAGSYLFRLRDDGTAPTLGEAYMNMKNSIKWRSNTADDNKLRFVLMGDPAMKLPTPEYVVNTTSIKGTEIAGLDAADYPVVEARSNPVFKGHILNPDGSVATDFNGQLYATIYDAEQTVTTYGWSEINENTGKVVTYNDYKTKLGETIVKVNNGEWELAANMPLEILNNYVPAKIVFYAVSDDGREGSGSCKSFYIYGVDTNAPADDKAPEIRRFTLNNDTFASGDLTNSTPVVFATVYDESGINISSSGIGHEMMLVIDRDLVYGDVSSHFTPDPEQPGMGHITYPLPALAPGAHTITLSVWDHAANSAYASLDFYVAASKDPEILDLKSTYSDDGSSVIFAVVSDRALSAINCTFEVFDLNGKRVWTHEQSGKTDNSSAMHAEWDFRNDAGSRVDRGIYVYRATVETPEGKSVAKSKKIAVSSASPLN